MNIKLSMETTIWFDGDDSGKKYRIEFQGRWITVYDDDDFEHEDKVKVKFWAEDLKMFIEMLYGKVVK